jgi:hypothetical protein
MDDGSLGLESICVTVAFMCPSHRSLIILLLCCLLPVQGALAFARSVGMVSHHARALQTATDTATDTAAEALQQHHQDHYQANHAGHGSVDKSEKAPAKSTPHSQASCTDCAKCCLTGATAPPPTAVQASSVSFVLSAFKPVSIEVAVHIPEKPERPPRAFPRALT